MVRINGEIKSTSKKIKYIFIVIALESHIQNLRLKTKKYFILRIWDQT